jgi:hypothetical protein
MVCTAGYSARARYAVYLRTQRASDVFSMWQSLIADYQVIDRSLLVKDVPKDKHYDYDYLISLLDWKANVDPNFKDDHFLAVAAINGKSKRMDA